MRKRVKSLSYKQYTALLPGPKGIYSTDFLGEVLQVLLDKEMRLYEEYRTRSAALESGMGY
jgi:hypothetical protein